MQFINKLIIPSILFYYLILLHFLASVSLAELPGPPIIKTSQDIINNEVTIANKGLLFNVKNFGAKGDGNADDTSAIQKAVSLAYNKGGGVVLFPPGTYLVTSLDIRENIIYEGYGATIKRPDFLTEKMGRKKAKWLRTFTNQKHPYVGRADSPPLIIKGLTFDGSSQTQGPYRNYELEQAALVFLTGDKKYPGRLIAVVEDCLFKNGPGDGVHAFVNTHLKMRNCRAENVFRGGFVLTGGNSVAEVTNLTTSGKIDPTGIDVEVDSSGYGNTKKVEVYLENHHLLDGNFDIGVCEGSTVVGKNIVAEAPFNLCTPDSKARFYNCKFGVGPGDRIIHPYDVSFQDCDFHAQERGNSKEPLSAAPFVAWNISGTHKKNQTLTFNHCKFLAPASRADYGILTGWDANNYHNLLAVNGGYLSDNLKTGVATRFRGGTWKIKDTIIEAALPFSWTGLEDKLGKSYCQIVIEGVKVRSRKYMHITGYSAPNQNKLQHINVTIDETANHITSSHGLEGVQYSGRRLILGTNPPTPETHGFIGDIYEVKIDNRQWVCKKPGYSSADEKIKVKSAWQPLPSP